MLLNEAQEAAVLDDSPACLVRANVGSGKTTVLTQKILYLHREKKVPYQRMAVMTFTRKAAAEILDRLGEMDEEEKEKLYFGTFHAAAAKLLRSALPGAAGSAKGLNASFRLITPEEELELARVLIKKHSLKIRYPNRLAKRLEQESGKDPKDDLERLRQLLKQEKEKSNCADYDDLIALAGDLWKSGEGPDFDWVIIDEVQDCDGRQMEMIDALMKRNPGTHLFAVGDPGQMIYGWRRGTGDVFRQLERTYGARVLDLPRNYRSGAEILKAAKWFRQGGEPLKADREDHSKIYVRSQPDPFAEADFLAARIAALHEGGIPWEQICILYRLKEQAKAPAAALEREKIPCFVHQGASREKNPAALWFERILRVLADPGDEISLALVLEDKHYTGKRAGELEEKIRGFAGTYPEGAGKEQIWEYIRPESFLHPTSARFREDLAAARAVLDSPPAAEGEHHKEVNEEGGVRLMTLHASKGLEFDHVFIIGVNDGLIPLSGTWDEEEKRLFYVGMTRARNTLELSFYLNPGMPGALPGEGRYLRTIPPELTIREVPAGPAVSMKELRLMVQEEKRRRGAASLEEEALADTGKKCASQNGPDRKGRRVTHERYGSGTVVSEDEMNITVCFDGYGEKEFIRAFANLTEEGC